MLRSMIDVGHPQRVWLLTGAHGVNEFYGVTLPPVLPLLVTELELTYGEAGGLLTIFFLAYSLCQLPAGFLTDRLGQGRMITGGLLLLAVGIFFASQAGDYLTLFAAQGVAGIGASTYHPAGMSLISDIESGATEGRAMGIHAFGGVAGTALAPVLIGGLAVAFDWRIALIGAAGVGIIYAILFSWQFHPPGTAPTNTAATPTLGESTNSTGLRAIVNIPRAWWVVGLFVTQFLIAFETSSVRTFATTYLYGRVGQSTTIANAVFFVMLIGGGVSSFGAGHLADRFDRKALGAGVMLLCGLILIITPMVPDSTFLLLGWFFVLGFLLYAVIPAMNALTAAYAEQSFSGGLFGVILTAASIGMGVGPLVIGFLAEWLGMATAFPLIGIASGLGVLAFLTLYRV